MIPSEGAEDFKETKLGLRLWWIARFIARHSPRLLLQAYVVHAWDLATAEKYTEVWWENVDIKTVLERIERDPQ